MKLVKIAIQNYEKKLVRDSRFDQKKLHAHIRSKQRVKDLIRTLKTANGTTITDPQTICSTQNNYFESIFDIKPLGDMPVFDNRTNKDKNRFEIRERFLGFIPVVDASGKGLIEKILKELEDNQIPIEDMRGQWYDNVANMKGKRLGDDPFVKVVDEAKKVAEILMIVSKFPDVSTIRIRKKKGHFDYESNDLSVIDSQQNYKFNFYFYILDTAIKPIDKRFEQLKLHVEKFQILYNIYKLKSENRTNMLKNCINLHLLLTENDKRDIDGLVLCEEIINLSAVLPSQMEPLEILNYLHENNITTIFPNLFNCLRILLTLPVSVASGERSFSKLKIIKNYLRLSMSQEYNFAELKTRRVNFKLKCSFK
ncbi:uncharacterized protein LOC136072264 [Hydra vulgaris]|uniref:uncharacterized protein LOC136072264 n=1 Tax=Hydra vulgaris TaxID=6087 RepID=UPI0032EA1356